MSARNVAGLEEAAAIAAPAGGRAYVRFEPSAYDLGIIDDLEPEPEIEP